MNDFYLFICLQTKTGIYLMQEGNEEPFNIRLHLARDILTIQEQDVICVSGEPFYSSVSNSARAPQTPEHQRQRQHRACSISAPNLVLINHESPLFSPLDRGLRDVI